MLPGAAALAAFVVELAVSGNLVANAGAIVINTVWYLIGVVAFLFAADTRAARRLLAATSLLVIGDAVGYGLTAHANADWAVVILLQTLGWTFECSVLALFAVFPDGIYQRSYERRTVIAALVLQVPLQIIQLAGSNSLGQPIFASTALRVPDPFFVIQLRSLGPAATALINGFLALSAGGALALLILRYRRFGSQQRHQIRWPFYGIAVAVAWGLLSNLLPSSSGPPTLTDTIIYLGPRVLLPVALAIGIVNPRFLDVDLVIRRSIVYGVLWLLIAAAYVGIGTTVGIALGQRVPLQLAILLTIAATLVFQPARHWLEQLGDRLVFGRRLGGYQLISQLGAELESSTAPKDVAGTVAAVVQTGLGARWVRVDLNRPQPTAVALAGAGTSENAVAALSAPLVHANQVVGRIECGPKLKGDCFYQATVGEDRRVYAPRKFLHVLK